jgi:hypothetical protein
MDEIYEKMLRQEIDDIVGDMMPTTMTVYDGEDGLITLLSCIKVRDDGYALIMPNIEHDHLISVLTSIKDVDIPYWYRKNSHRNSEEFESLDIEHLAGYVKFHNNSLYTLSITGLSYPIIRKITSILFGL